MDYELSDVPTAVPVVVALLVLDWVVAAILYPSTFLNCDTPFIFAVPCKITYSMLVAFVAAVVVLVAGGVVLAAFVGVAYGARTVLS